MRMNKFYFIGLTVLFLLLLMLASHLFDFSSSSVIPSESVDIIDSYSAINQSNIVRTPSPLIYPNGSQLASAGNGTAGRDNCNSTELFEEENQRRLEWIEEQCMNNSRLSIMYEIFYFRKFGLGWCPVYKAASSNVLAQFCSHYFSDKICHDKTKNGATLYRSSKIFREPEFLSNKEKRFVIVRDPLKRLLSAYRDKMEQLRETFFKNPARDMMLHHRPINWNINFHRDKSSQEAIDYAEAMTENKVLDIPADDNPYLYPPYPTFKEFVSEVIAGWGNPHIVPASQYCGPCGSTKKFDFILKVETFDCDMRHMLEISGNSVYSLPETADRWATNKGPEGNTSLLYSYYSTLSSDQLEGLLRYYHDDCLLYQYPCQELVDDIRSFQLRYPDHQYKYRNTWSGRTLS